MTAALEVLGEVFGIVVMIGGSWAIGELLGLGSPR